MEQAFLEKALVHAKGQRCGDELIPDDFYKDLPVYLRVAINSIKIYAASMPDNENAQSLAKQMVEEYEKELRSIVLETS